MVAGNMNWEPRHKMVAENKNCIERSITNTLLITTTKNCVQRRRT
jgi:hypothetical protein